MTPRGAYLLLFLVLGVVFFVFLSSSGNIPSTSGITIYTAFLLGFGVAGIWLLSKSRVGR